MEAADPGMITTAITTEDSVNPVAVHLLRILVGVCPAAINRSANHPVMVVEVAVAQ